MRPSHAGVDARVRRYYLFQVLVAFQLWSPFWTLWLFDRLANDFFLATVVDVAFWVVSLAVSMPAGAIADRYGRRPALLIGVGIWLGGIVLFGLSGTFVAFIVANAVWALGAGFLWGAGSAYLYDTLVEARLEARYPALSSGVALYSFLGTAAASALGGFIVSTTHRFDLPLILYAAPGLAAFLVAWTFREPTIPRSPEPNLVKQISGGLRTATRNAQILFVIVFQVIVGLVTYIMAFFRPAFMSQVTQGNFLLMGALYSLFFCIAAVSGLSVGRLLDRFGETGGLILAFLLVFPPFILVYTVSQGFFAPNLALGLGLLSQAFDYTFWGIEGPLVTTILNRRVGSQERATVLAINSFFATLVIAILEPMVGLVAHDYNFGVALGALALGASVPAALVLLGFRRSTRAHGILTAYPRARGLPPASPATLGDGGPNPGEDAASNQIR